MSRNRLNRHGFAWTAAIALVAVASLGGCEAKEEQSTGPSPIESISIPSATEFLEAPYDRSGTGEDLATEDMEVSRFGELPNIALDLAPGDRVIAPRAIVPETVLTQADPALHFETQEFVGFDDDGRPLVKPQLGDAHPVPSALVLPVPSGSTVEAGDEVVVVAAGRVITGRVRSVRGREALVAGRSRDMQLTARYPVADVLKRTPDHVAGMWAHCSHDGRVQPYTVLREVEGVYIATSGRDMPQLLSKDICDLLPLNPEVQTGDLIAAFALGDVRHMRVASVDSERQVLEAAIDWRGARRVLDVRFGLFEIVDEDEDAPDDEQ